jgi:hypothetical protein
MSGNIKINKYLGKRSKVAPAYCGRDFHTRYRRVAHMCYNSSHGKSFHPSAVNDIDSESYIELEKGEGTRPETWFPSSSAFE